MAWALHAVECYKEAASPINNILPGRINVNWHLKHLLVILSASLLMNKVWQHSCFSNQTKDTHLFDSAYAELCYQIMWFKLLAKQYGTSLWISDEKQCIISDIISAPNASWWSFRDPSAISQLFRHFHVFMDGFCFRKTFSQTNSNQCLVKIFEVIFMN